MCWYGSDRDLQQSPQTQKEVDQMGNEKADEVSDHAVPWQEKIQEQNIQKGCEDIVPNTDFLLAQAFGHGIRHDVAVEHGNQQRIGTHRF